MGDMRDMGDMVDIGMVYMCVPQMVCPWDMGDMGVMGDMGDICMVYMCVPQMVCPWDMGDMGDMGDIGMIYMCVPQIVCPWDMGDMGKISLVDMCVYPRLCARGTLGKWGTLVWYIFVCTPIVVLVGHGGYGRHWYGRYVCLPQIMCP